MSNRIKKILKEFPKDKCGGIVVIDKLNDDYYVLLGSRLSGSRRIYEYFGGNNEPQDLTAFHTSIREFIEELFNVKIDVSSINKLVEEIIEDNDIKNELTFVHPNGNMTYFIGFGSLEKVSNFIKYRKYKRIDNLDLSKYINNREIHGEPNNGLNEINDIHIYRLDEVLKLELRDVAERITNYLVNKLL